MIDTTNDHGTGCTFAAAITAHLALGYSLEDAIPVTSKWIAGLRATPEAREGFAAFLGKRKPNWM